MKKISLICIVAFATALALFAGCSQTSESGSFSGVFTDKNIYSINIYPADGTSHSSGTAFKFYAVTASNGNELIKEDIDISWSSSAGTSISFGGSILGYSGEAYGNNITVTGSSGGWVQIKLTWANRGVSATARYYIS